LNGTEAPFFDTTRLIMDFSPQFKRAPYAAISRTFRANSRGFIPRIWSATVRNSSKTRHGIKAAWLAGLSKTQINAWRFTNASSPRTRPGFARLMLFVSLTWFFTGWASPPRSTNGGASEPGAPVPPVDADGVASYYGKEHHGRKTANGEIFDMNKLTAAHRSLPFGALVKVTNLSNQRSVIVRINDRGPYYQGRIIDLSQAAAERLEMITSGITKVKLEVLDAKRPSAN
jgi:rare lipoprotein A